MRHLLVVAPPLALALGLSGCPASFQVPEGAQLACETQADCPADFKCNTLLKRCRPLSDDDSQAPSVVGAVQVFDDPARERDVAAGSARTTFFVRFEASEPLAQEPGVHLDAGGQRVDLSLLGEFSPAATQFEFTLPAGAVAAEGTFPLDVEMIDASGNRSEGRLGRGLTFDFTGPAVAAANASPHSARLGSTVAVTVAFSEPLAVPPVPTFAPALPGLGAPVASGLAYVWRLPIDSQVASGRYVLASVAATDRVGNAAAAAPETADGKPVAFEVDSEPPTIDAVVVSPRRLAPGGSLTVAVAVEDLGAGGLEVTLDGLGAVPCGAYDAAAGGYACSLEQVAMAPGEERAHLLLVRAADAAGNEAVAADDVVFDSRPPAVWKSAVSLRADAANLVQAPRSLRDGTTVSVSFSTTEPLRVDAPDGAPPAVDLVCAGGDPLALSRRAGETGDTYFGYLRTLAAADAAADGPCELKATLVDRAGNAAEVVLGAAQVDRTAPAAPDTAPGRLRYTRVPWGSQATAGAKRFTLDGPADPGTGAGPVEPDAEVIALDGADLAKAALLGRGPAAADGTFGPLALERADRPQVYVAALDGAGNASAPVPVRDVTWVATLGFKAPGDASSNPHRFEARAHATGLLVEAAAVEPGDLAALAAPGGGEVATAGLGAWRELTPSSLAPPPMYGAAMAYDSARGVAVLVGGQGGSLSDQTWEHDGVRWRLVCGSGTACSGPAAIAQHALAYDAARGEVLLFGGEREGAGSDELWAWDGARWRLACGGTSGCAGPSARRNPVLSDDVDRGRVVAYGGFAGSAYSDETWEWDGTAWTLACGGAHPTCAGPAGLEAPALAYDRERRRTVLFGGQQGGGALRDEVWLWDGQAWSAPACGGSTGCSGPSARALAVAAWDPGSREVLLLGGATDFGATAANDLWAWGGSSWRRVCDGASCPMPPARTRRAAAYDARRGRLVAFGGSSAVAASGACDVAKLGVDCAPEESCAAGACQLQALGGAAWEWDGAAWAATHDPSKPLANSRKRSGHAMAYDPVRRAILAFGGEGGAGGPDLWQLSGGWRPACVFGMACFLQRPAASVGSGLAFDAAPGRGVALVFGGAENGEYSGLFSDETWGWDGAAWAQRCGGALGPCGPEARAFGALAFDAVRGQVVLFGGQTTNPSGPPDAVLGDTWVWDGAAWALRPCSGSCPSARTRHGLAYDEARGRVVLFGGASQAGATLSDTWEWDGSGWALACDGVAGSCLAPPGGRREHALAYDPARGRVVAFGGWSGSGSLADDTWSWDGARWERVCARSLGCAGPSARVQAAMAADPARGGVVLFGGSGAGGDQTWLWEGGAASRVDHRFSVDFAAARAEGAAVQAVRALWRAGGEAGSTAGAELRVWERGAWQEVDEHSSAAAAGLDWATTDPVLLGRLWRGPERTLELSAATKVASGAAAARLTSDYVEVEVDYRLP